MRHCTLQLAVYSIVASEAAVLIRVEHGSQCDTSLCVFFHMPSVFVSFSPVS